MKPEAFPHFLADFSHPFFLPGIYISAARSRPDNPIITSAPQPLSPGSIDLLHSPVLADLVLFALLRVYAKLMGSTLYSQVSPHFMCRETRGTYHPLRSLVYWKANAAPALPHSALCHSDTSPIPLAASLPPMQVMRCVAEFDRGVASRLAALREQARGRAAREALEEARLQVCVCGGRGLWGTRLKVAGGVMGGRGPRARTLEGTGCACGMECGGGLRGVQAQGNYF